MPGGGARCIRVRPCSATCRLSLTAPSAFRPFDNRFCTGRMLFSVFSVFCFPPIQVLFIAVGHGSFLKETSGGGDWFLLGGSGFAAFFLRVPFPRASTYSRSAMSVG